MAGVLIVDDSIVMRKNLKLILSRAGYEIVGEASNGKQALLEYVRCKADIITMDITMPIMDGIEATKLIKEKHPEAKIIIISGLDQKKMVFNALEAGAVHYIIKPVTAEKTVKVIEEVLNRK